MSQENPQSLPELGGGYDQLAERALLIVVACTLIIYPVYRWPFQINTAQAGAAYRDTPFALQSGKYLLLLLLAGALAIVLRRVILDPASLALLTLVAWLLVRSAAYATEWQLIADVIAPLAIALPFVLLLRPDALVMGVVRLAVIAFVILNAISVFVQFIGWAGFGRLPGLSWEGGIKRFGGLWDDPNSSAAASALVILAVLAGLIVLPRRLKITLLVLSALCLGAALSVSGVLVLLAGLVYFVRNIRTKVIIVMTGTVLAAFLLLAPTAWFPMQLGDWVASKRDSGLSRINEPLPALKVPEILTGNLSLGGSSETYVIWLASLFGVVGLCLFAWWVLILWRSSSPTVRPLIFGALIGSLIVPFPATYPLGTVLVLLGSLAARIGMQKRQTAGWHDDQPDPRAIVPSN